MRGLKGKSSVIEKLRKRLRGTRFRCMNQTIDNRKSIENLRAFQENPEEFREYHALYKSQMSKWPCGDPLRLIISWIESVRCKDRKLIVADLGCGDARLATALDGKWKGKTKIEVLSFDLCDALNEKVQVCDMRDLPLANESIDVVVICLSLVGTDSLDALCSSEFVVSRETKIHTLVNKGS
ncbi:hypothetical protein ACOME3_001433 [Neoechinorhynchus agilis]